MKSNYSIAHEIFPGFVFYMPMIFPFKDLGHNIMEFRDRDQHGRKLVVKRPIDASDLLIYCC